MSTAPHDYVRGRWLFGLRAPARGIAAVELAAVIAVSLIMAALAVSAYRTHSVRTEIATVIAATALVRHAVERHFAHTGLPPVALSDLGLRHAIDSELLESVHVDHGRIELRFGNTADAALAGQSLYLVPFETADRDVVWVCGNSPPDVGLEPLGFASGVDPADRKQTQIEPRFLPRDCR